MFDHKRKWNSDLDVIKAPAKDAEKKGYQSPVNPASVTVRGGLEKTSSNTPASPDDVGKDR